MQYRIAAMALSCMLMCSTASAVSCGEVQEQLSGVKDHAIAWITENPGCTAATAAVLMVGICACVGAHSDYSVSQDLWNPLHDFQYTQDTTAQVQSENTTSSQESSSQAVSEEQREQDAAEKQHEQNGQQHESEVVQDGVNHETEPQVSHEQQDVPEDQQTLFDTYVDYAYYTHSLFE